MSGHTPFEPADPDDVLTVFAGIQSAVVSYPNSMKKPVKDFIRSLLKPNPIHRLPVREGGISNLPTQKWYKDFPWDDCCRQSMTAPFEPKSEVERTSNTEVDVSLFAGMGEADPLVEHRYVNDGSGWDAGFATST
jgi:serine/threonine protein kinase